MINPDYIRENPDKVKEALTNRNHTLTDLETFIEADQEWRACLTEIDALKHQRNQLNPKGKPTQEQLDQLKELSNSIKEKQEHLDTLDEKVKTIAKYLPNIPQDSVPVGKNEEDNVEVYTHGTPKTFDFTPRSHDELAEQLNILDFENATKITGSRFVVYKGQGAKLERALINFMLDHHTTHNGYEEIIPPVMVNSQSMTGTGQLPKFADDSFKIEDTDYWLSPTSEVQLTNLVSQSVLNEEDLPISLTAYTNCFRKEAGSYGKDITGIIRLHQFNKVELVKIVTPEQSHDELEKLTGHAESILQALELPYRKVALCTGDLGFSSSKTYDLEVWFPSQNKYREISSCSNFLDFQSRRAMIRYKNKGSKSTIYAHTLNGSGLAVGRTFAAILENYQTKDGTVILPKALHRYLNIEEIK